MEATHRLSPLVIAAKGCIVQVGSLTSVIPVPFNAAYVASIAALHSFGDTLRVELAPLGVKVLTASPSFLAR
jgi:1-acylglycerone phosphate reductase